MNKLEVCCADIESVLAAKTSGADRIELCSALEVGGVTPSHGMITEAIKIFGKGVFVLIRERPGDFIYSTLELEVMKKDISFAVEAGADGIVLGALTQEKEVDTAALYYLLEGVSDVEITFHRAFDEVKNPFKALEDIIKTGCKRILTSGLQAGAELGIPLIKELNDKANSRIIILPGAGVTFKNAEKILKETGCSEIHASAKQSFHDTCISSEELINKIKKSIS